MAIVLFYREFETLFLAGASGMAGQAIEDPRGRVIATVKADTYSHPNPEFPRDAKGWVKQNLVSGYKPTLLQAALTKLLDPVDMEAKGLSSYRRFVSALRFLSANQGVAGAVYPPSPPEAPDG
ncbi:MAG: hypothetical protein ACT4OM_04675 [Actinomycetota bacterium]